MFRSLSICLALQLCVAAALAQDAKTTDRKTKGFINITQLTVNTSNGHQGSSTSSRDNSYGLKTINGYQFSPFFAMGPGVGFDYYPPHSLKAIPVTLDLRFAFLKTVASPAVNVYGGHTFGIDKSVEGTVYGITFGLRAYVSRSTALVFDAGMKWQQMDIYKWLPNYTIEKDKAYVQYISINFGFSF